MRILEELGFTKSEIAIYLSLLKLGESTAGSIIQDAKIQSSVFHRVVKILVNKGIVTYITIGKDKHYQVVDPQSLVEYVDFKKQELQTKVNELEKLKNPLHRPSAEMFVGKLAVFRALLKILDELEKGDEYLSFSLTQPHEDKEIIRFYQQYNAKRRDKGLTVKVLVHSDVKKIYEKNYSIDLLRKAKVRYTSTRHPQGLVITKNTVSFINWDSQPTVIVVTNPTMASKYKEFFYDLYEKEKDAY